AAVAGALLASCNGGTQLAPTSTQQSLTQTALHGSPTLVVKSPDSIHRQLPGYTFFGFGTLGGPQSDFQGDSPILNEQNQAFGFADTAAASPCYPNCNPMHPPDPYLFHAFVWNGSGLTDMGALPGSNDSVAESAGASGGATGQSENGMIDPL